MESGHADSGSGVGVGHADAGIRERWVTRTVIRDQTSPNNGCEKSTFNLIIILNCNNGHLVY
jgi:hypothetical protein